MADIYRDGILYNTSKAIKNGQEYLFDWTMLNEYNSLQNYMNGAQADLKTSIENKGITVPPSATLDQYYLYVNQISAAARGLATGITTYANTIVTGAQYGMQRGPFVSWNDSDGNLYGVCSYCELTSSSEYYSFCGFSKVGTSDIQYYHPSEQSGSYSYNPVTEHLRVFKNGDIVRVFFTTWSTRDTACAFAGEWNLANNNTSVSCIGGVSSYDPSDWGYDLTGWDEIVDSTWVQDITTERQDSTGKMYLTLKLDSIWESYVYACQADLKTAIENKGVTVPSSATLDEYASYVDQIETRGPWMSHLVTPQGRYLTYRYSYTNFTPVSWEYNGVAYGVGNIYWNTGSSGFKDYEGVICAKITPDTGIAGTTYAFGRTSSDEQTNRSDRPVRWSVWKTANSSSVKVFIFLDRLPSSSYPQSGTFCFGYTWDTSGTSVTPTAEKNGTLYDYDPTNYGFDLTGYEQVTGSTWISSLALDYSNDYVLYSFNIKD